ncbi:MAG: TldD/PmbA family protein [Thermoplasmatales archaeon]|nr:TldD/PmbA family protein [Thermoplasmatales archaeon]
MIKDLSSYEKLFTEYTELRVQENRVVRIVLVNGDVMQNNKTSISGVSARVYKDGIWGFASNPTISDDEIKMVVQSATKNALFLNSREQKKKGSLPVVSAIAENDFSTQKTKKSQKELIEFVKEIDNYITKKYSNLNSRTVVLNCLDMEKSLLTSDKSSSFSMIPRTIIYVVMSVEKDGQPFELYDVYGGFGQFEDTFFSPEPLFGKIDNQYEHLIKKSEGVYAEAGVKDCILDADLAGILAHEAIGHTTEADIVLGGSIAAEYMNQQVANPLITLVDFANTALGKLCPIPVFIDDEGTKAEDVVIIENGVLKSFLHNKDSANHFNTKPTGNARAYKFSDEPLIRMRNTAILPQESKLQDMIASIDNGYYLMKPSNGEADSTSEFMFGIVQGYEIKNGKLGRAIKDTTISGVAFDMLKTVSMVSDDMSWICGGMCGKKQLIPVGMGGPAIKCKVNIGGR